MSERLKSILFAAALCIVCSMLLTAASAGLKKYQQNNLKNDRRKNILKSIGLVTSAADYTPDEINRLYSENITKVYTDTAGNIIDATNTENRETAPDIALPIYLYIPKNKPLEAYIIPIDTKGLWGKILGYLAVKNDGKTIAGFTVYKHSETPGLGGEIEQAWFQKNFVGKKIVNLKGEFVSVAVAKGKVGDAVPKQQRLNYVDGISGATITGKMLSSGLKDILTSYEPVSVNLRNKLQYCQTNPNVPWCVYEKK